jgi:hypothetical protein
METRNVYLRDVYKTTNDYGKIICCKIYECGLGRGSCGCRGCGKKRQCMMVLLKDFFFYSLPIFPIGIFFIDFKP